MVLCAHNFPLIIIYTHLEMHWHYTGTNPYMDQLDTLILDCIYDLLSTDFCLARSQYIKAIPWFAYDCNFVGYNGAFMYEHTSTHT